MSAGVFHLVKDNQSNVLIDKAVEKDDITVLEGHRHIDSLADPDQDLEIEGCIQ